MEKRLSGGYIQLWGGMNEDETWKAVVSEMKSLGMDRIIIQYMSSGVNLDESMSIASMILKYAKRKNMEVFLGLQKGLTGDLSSVELVNLDTSKEKSLKIADRLKTAFEHEEKFYGWHIPLESWMSNYDDATTVNLQNYYKSLTTELKKILPKKVLISPFVNSPNIGSKTNLKRTTPEETRATYTTILQDTGIDFLALQDGVGAGHISVSDPGLPEYFSAMCDACKENNIELWANIESFTWISGIGKGTASDIERFRKQLEVAQGASRIITFDFFHYMNSTSILTGDSRPTGYKQAVIALNQGYRAWKEERETSKKAEPCRF